MADTNAVLPQVDPKTNRPLTGKAALDAVLQESFRLANRDYLNNQIKGDLSEKFKALDLAQAVDMAMTKLDLQDQELRNNLRNQIVDNEGYQNRFALEKQFNKPAAQTQPTPSSDESSIQSDTTSTPQTGPRDQVQTISASDYDQGSGSQTGSDTNQRSGYTGPVAPGVGGIPTDPSSQATRNDPAQLTPDEDPGIGNNQEQVVSPEEGITQQGSSQSSDLPNGAPGSTIADSGQQDDSNRPESNPTAEGGPTSGEQSQPNQQQDGSELTQNEKSPDVDNKEQKDAEGSKDAGKNTDQPQTATPSDQLDPNQQSGNEEQPNQPTPGDGSQSDTSPKTATDSQKPAESGKGPKGANTEIDSSPQSSSTSKQPSQLPEIHNPQNRIAPRSDTGIPSPGSANIPITKSDGSAINPATGKKITPVQGMKIAKDVKEKGVKGAAEEKLKEEAKKRAAKEAARLAKAAAQKAAMAAKAAAQAAAAAVQATATAISTAPAWVGALAVALVVAIIFILIFAGSAGATVAVYCTPENFPRGTRLVVDRVIDDELKRAIEEACGISNCGGELASVGAGFDCESNRVTYDAGLDDKGRFRYRGDVANLRFIPDNPNLYYALMGMRSQEFNGFDENFVGGDRDSCGPYQQRLNEIYQDANTAIKSASDTIRAELGMGPISGTGDADCRRIIEEAGAGFFDRLAIERLKLEGAYDDILRYDLNSDAGLLAMAKKLCDTQRPDAYKGGGVGCPVESYYVQNVYYALKSFVSTRLYEATLEDCNKSSSVAYTPNEFKYQTRLHHNQLSSLIVGSMYDAFVIIDNMVMGVSANAQSRPSSYASLSDNHVSFLEWVAKERGYVGYPDLNAVDPDAQKAANDFVAFANTQGIQMIIVSEYRSYDQQVGTYFRTDGGNAIQNIYDESTPIPDSVPENIRNQYLARGEFSAPPGYSEHSTGLAFDFAANNISGTSSLNVASFNGTVPSGETFAQWLETNAPNYGFRLSYPENSTSGAGYEPWHFGYVGNPDNGYPEPEQSLEELAGETKTVGEVIGDACATSASGEVLFESDGVFANPAPGFPATSPFGYRIHPVYGTTRLHSGADIGTPQGTPIGASRDGEVTFADTAGGYGYLIIISHDDGFETYYAHMSEMQVSVGDLVEQGQQIGLSGGAGGTAGAGTSTGPHLHFEIRKGGVPIDPRQYITI